VFWFAPLSLFNSTSEILGVGNFTYTATDDFDLASFLGSTSLNVEGANTTTSVNWQQQVESNVAGVAFEIRNGYCAMSDISVVRQKNMSTIAPQQIQLAAEDFTVTNPVITLTITSLPAKGALFDVGSTLPITVVPHPIPAASNFSMGYQPSLPTDSYGFEFSPTYASFQFYASSNGKTSNTATQTLNVIDTNDEVSITWYGPTNADGELFFSSPSDPIPSWSDVPDNNLYINFTDPDGVVAGEPWYNIKLDSINSDFCIFTNPDYYDELVALKTASAGGADLGFLVFPGVKGRMASSWELTVNRSFAQKFLNPIRLRPNRPTGSTLTIKITDCQKIPTPSPYATSSQFDSSMNWAPIQVTKSIVIRGDISKPPEYQGVANQTILAVVYGVVGSVVFCVLLICGVLGVCWCLVRRRRDGGGGGDGSIRLGDGSTSFRSSRSSNGSPSKKGKKDQPVYVQTVEL